MIFLSDACSSSDLSLTLASASSLPVRRSAGRRRSRPVLAHSSLICATIRPGKPLWFFISQNTQPFRRSKSAGRNRSIRLITPSLARLSDPPIPQWQGLLFSAIAPMIATLMTNPFDLARTRMQLQGQIAGASAKAIPISYSNALDCLVKTARAEGVTALWKGIGTALVRESVVNGLKLGLYEPILSLYHKEEDGSAPVWKRLLAGAATGFIGAVVANPLDFVKSRLQSQAGWAASGVGGMGVFKSVLKDAGFATLYKGTELSMVKSIVSTSITLTLYTRFREVAIKEKMFRPGPLLDATASLLCAFACTCIVNPIDVVRTRLYNQPYDRMGVGVLYASAVDCALKLVRAEGSLSLYKGFISNFLGRGPALVISFTCLEWMRRLAKHNLALKRQASLLKEAFNVFDQDRSGSIDRQELLAALMAAYPRQPLFQGGLSMSRAQYQLWLQRKVSSLFEKADKDKDDLINYKEFIAASDDFCGVIRRAQIVASFQTLDSNSDGVISRSELLTALKSIAPADIQHLSETDYEETLNASLEKMMKIADVDGDGRVTFDDFQRMVEGAEALSEGHALASWLRNAGVAVS